MKLNTSRFGEIDIDETKVIDFSDGLPGLEELKRFILVTTEETEPFMWFQSLDEADIALAVLNPFTLFPDYEPNIPDMIMEELGFKTDGGTPENLLILAVAVVPSDFKKMTVNLVSPLIVNSERNVGKQVITEGGDYLIRQPIYDLLQDYVIKEGQ